MIHTAFRKLVVLITLLFLSIPALAGHWEIDHYLLSGGGISETHTDNPLSDDYPVRKFPGIITTGMLNFSTPDKRVMRYNFTPNAPLTIEGHLTYIGPAPEQGRIGPGRVLCQATVTPVFKWYPSSENDLVPETLIIREYSNAQIVRAHRVYGINLYTLEDPYEGKNLDIVKLSNGFQGEVGHAIVPNPSDASGPGTIISNSVQGSYITVIRTGGQAQFEGPARTLCAEVTSPGWTRADMGATWFNSNPTARADVTLRYSANIEDLRLVASISPELNPVYTSLGYQDKVTADADAKRVWRGTETSYPWLQFFWDDTAGAPIEYFWNGPVSYRVQASPGLAEHLGPATYSWSFVPNTATANMDPSQPLTPDQDPAVSTSSKVVNHAMSPPYDTKELWVDDAPRTSTAQVYVTGGTETPIFGRKAEITWNKVPATRHRVELKYEVIPLDGSAPDDGADDIWQYALEIEATNKEVVKTGATLVRTALEGEMAVGSWFVPDEFDVALGAFKIVKAAKLADKIYDGLKPVVHTSLDLLKARRVAAGKNDRVAVRLTIEVINEGLVGKKVAHAVEDVQDVGKTERRVCCAGAHCFGAGTPIRLADGTTKSIEQIKKGDMVLSRNPENGETSGQKVLETFYRSANATLLLTFANGERIEVTEEHPFYVEGKGFTSAGLLAIGNSIVTRAGPSVELQEIQRKGAEVAVYNLDVDGFHTYFVGNVGLWVHNTDCEVFPQIDPVKLPKHSSSRQLTPGVEPGEYVYVRDVDGVLHIAQNGKHMHSQVLGGGQPVTAAGTIKIGQDGSVLEVTNFSGNFQPTAATVNSVIDDLRGLGFVVADNAGKAWDWTIP